MATAERRRRDNDRGMTLIEIMIVLTILGLVMGIVGVAAVSKLKEAKIDTAKLQMKAIEGALEDYLRVAGNYPTTEQGLEALVARPAGETRWKGPYIKGGKLPKDPWGEQFLYYAPGVSGEHEYEIISKGSDKAEGGEEYAADIKSWDDGDETAEE